MELNIGGLLTEVLKMPIRHVQTITQRGNPEWYALHRALVQKARGYGILSLMTPQLEEDDTVPIDLRFSGRVLGGGIKMRRFVHTWEDLDFQIRGTRFVQDDAAVFVMGTAIKTVKTPTITHSLVQMFVAGSTAEEAQTVAIRLARVVQSSR